MNSQMTDFALAGKCEGFGASGLSAGEPGASATGGAARHPCWSSRAARASRPQPWPGRRRNCRRVANAGSAKWCGMAGMARSLDVNELIQAHQRLAEVHQSPLRGVTLAAVRLALLPQERD